MNIADGTFLRNFLDFGQFTVDSREVNIENNQKKINVYSSPTAYIRRLNLSRGRVNLSFCSWIQ